MWKLKIKTFIFFIFIPKFAGLIKIFTATNLNNS